MQSFLVLLAAATLAAAHYYPLDGEAPAMAHSRHFRNRRGGPLDEGDVCKIKAVPDYIRNQVLNTTDIALCQASLLAWTNDPTSQLQNTGGGPGLRSNSGGVDCQVCNFDSLPRHISSDDLKTLFGAITNCGSYDQPQMGFGYTDALDDHGFYVAYAPKDQLLPCYTHEHGKGGLEGAD